MLSGLPKKINQAHIGVLLGGTGIYFLFRLDLDIILKYFSVILVSAYTFHMGILSCFQMIKHTQRFRNKEKLDKEKREHEIKIEKIKLETMKAKIECEKIKAKDK